MSNNSRNSYDIIKELLEYTKHNNVFIVKYSSGILENVIENLKIGNLIYNIDDPFLENRKKCISLEYKNVPTNTNNTYTEDSEWHDILNSELNILYDYALKYDIQSAPKTVTLGVNIKASKFFLD